MADQSTEPLPKLIARMQQKRRVRPEPPNAQGMREIVTPMDSLSAQAEMDDWQMTTVGGPVGQAMPRNPVALSSVRDEDAPESPAAVMTAGFRRGSDQRSAPVSTVQCPGGRCPVPGRTQITNQYNFSPSERVIAIDGVPVGQGMPMAPPVQMAAPTISGGAPTVSMPPSSGFPGSSWVDSLAGDTDPQAMNLLRAADALNAQAQGMGSYIDKAQPIVTSRVLVEAAANRIANQDSAAMTRQMLALELQDSQLDAQRQRAEMQTVEEGRLQNWFQRRMDALQGQGEWGLVDPRERALYATQMERERIAPTLAPQETFNEQQYYANNLGQAISHDIGSAITRTGQVTPDGFRFSPGSADVVDRLVLSTYVNLDGGLDSAGKPMGILKGRALQARMHRDLTPNVASQISDAIMANSVPLDRKIVDQYAMKTAMQLVDDYYTLADAATSAGGNWENFLRAVDDGLRQPPQPPRAVQPNGEVVD